LPTLTLLAILYVAVIISLAFAPHVVDSSSLGKMGLHQIYAGVGRILSFGLVNRTLVDWHMPGPTEENIAPYNRFVRHSIMILTPVFSLWILGIAFLVPIISADLKRLRRGPHRTGKLTR
jgi:hypothetical protein